MVISKGALPKIGITEQMALFSSGEKETREGRGRKPYAEGDKGVVSEREKYPLVQGGKFSRRFLAFSGAGQISEEKDTSALACAPVGIKKPLRS